MHNLFKRIFLKYWKQDGKHKKAWNRLHLFTFLFELGPIFPIFLFIKLADLVVSLFISDFLLVLLLFIIFFFNFARWCCSGKCIANRVYSIWSFLWEDLRQLDSHIWQLKEWWVYLRWKWFWRTAHQVFVLIPNRFLHILQNRGTRIEIFVVIGGEHRVSYLHVDLIWFPPPF